MHKLHSVQILVMFKVKREQDLLERHAPIPLKLLILLLLLQFYFTHFLYALWRGGASCCLQDITWETKRAFTAWRMTTL